MHQRWIKMIAALACCGFLLMGFGIYKVLLDPGKAILAGKPADSSGQELNRQETILLVGADQRPGETNFNTDSIILAGINPQTKRISLLSIPRDTRILLPGHGYVKINSVCALTDMQTLQACLTDLTGEPISGYIQTNFQGFKHIIDTLGGVTVNVEKDMYYETGDQQDGYINLHKGLQRLDGEKALEYARFRHDSLSDISRTARQQVILKSLAKELFQLSTVPKLPALIPQLFQVVRTNLSVRDLYTLAKVAVGFNSSNVISQTLPGEFLDLNGVSYWQVDPNGTRTVVSQLEQGITTDKVVDQEPVDLLKPETTPPKKPETTPQKNSEIPLPGNNLDPNGEGSTDFTEFEFFNGQDY